MTDSTPSLLVEQMLKPDFYPHPVSEPIQLIQTHISYVFLTGDYAYKVKKPLKFDFPLDYTTLEKRHYYCQEELRLNQRGAPGLYLEVVPITQQDHHLALAGEGEAVEYAVKMQQFPQDTLLATLFEQGKLTDELVVRLAKAIATFHQDAYTDDYIRTFGEIAKIRQSIDENYTETLSYIGGPQTQKQWDETRDYTNRFFAERQAVFARRRQADQIKECHGDIHLRNICYWNDTLYLFDCIEFNEPFRFVDVMFDVAYIVMDLAAGQRKDLVALFLNTYLEQTGDWDGLEILPLYVSRQSYVRAKVISFLLNNPSVSEQQKADASNTAALYYKLAWEVCQPGQGQLIVMAGLSGAGKSTVARQLASQMSAIHIRSDAVRKHMGGLPLDQRGDASLYSPEMTEATYTRLIELGCALAQEGYPVILDAKFDRHRWRQRVLDTAQRDQIPVHFLHCTAPMEVLQQRVRQRQGDIADATTDVLAKQQMEPFADEELPYLYTIDTTQDWGANLAKVKSELK